MAFPERYQGVAETPPLFICPACLRAAVGIHGLSHHIFGMRDTVRSEWQKTILVCGKCSKKVGGGFGLKGNTPLVKALKALSNGRKGRKADIGLIETKCLKLCPKRHVVAIDASESATWHLIEPGTPIERVVRLLGLFNAS